jgi:hypothetical protein
MPDYSKITLSEFEPSQAETLYKILVFQKLCPGKFLLDDPYPNAELQEDELWELKRRLNNLMPLESMIIDLWDYDLHFEETTFEATYFDVACGPADLANAEAESLQEEFLNWNIEYNMGYDQADWEEGEYEKWVLEECKNFIKKWRQNIYDKSIKALNQR